MGDGVKKILYVEDAPAARRLVRRILGYRYTVLEAADGLAGIEIARREHPDLILMDLRIPGLDGYELTTRLKAVAPEVPIVALTADTSPEARARALAAGCDGYIAKPIQAERLLREVEEFLAGRRDELAEGERETHLRAYQQRLVERLEQKVRLLSQANERLTALLETSREISSTLDLQAILKLIATRAQNLLDADDSDLYLLNQDTQRLEPVVCLGAHAQETQAISLALGEGITGWVARTGQPEIVNRADLDPRAKHVPGTPWEPESLLCVPLLSRGKVIGVMRLSRRGERGFSQEDLRFLVSLAHHASIAIENARLFENLRMAQERIVRAEKLRALGQMASGVAHDFNNLLSVILARTGLLLQVVKDEEARHDLRRIQQAAQDGAEIVRRIQLFGRPDAPRCFVPVDLNEIVRDAVAVTKPKWHSRERVGTAPIQVHTHLADLPSIQGNPAELREVLINLIFNAVEAMPEGGELVIRTEPLEKGVRLIVQDTGMGMSDEVKRRLFEPFFTTKGAEGTGLGLSVAYGIVTWHGGTIKVDSEIGLGTTFVIELPYHHPFPE